MLTVINFSNRKSIILIVLPKQDIKFKYLLYFSQNFQILSKSVLVFIALLNN